MMRILVLGSRGMAGHVIAAHLESLGYHEVIRCARSSDVCGTVGLDVTDFTQLETVLTEVRPDIVINCVGVLVEASQSNVGRAILINSYLPHLLSILGKKLGFRLIQIGTDCVFSGKKGQYKESDFRDGDTAYARTKALGEIDNDTDLTVRTSIIGPELKKDGRGLLHWFLNQQGIIKGFTKVYWSGVTTLELAKGISYFIRKEYSGLVHFTMPEKISKYQLLMLFRETWNRDLVIEGDDSYWSDKSLVALRSDAQYSLPDYRQMLRELADFMQANSNRYPHY